jgi:CarD family transcriptional regulator
MKFTVGNKVSYPSQGPCLIRPVIKKMVNGSTRSFYPLALLDGSGGELFIPIEKVGAVGLRQLLQKSDIPKLLSRLRKRSETAVNWKQRTIDNLKLFASGSPFDLAEIVESLTALNETRTLSPRDRQTLDRARKLLVCEIAEVTGETKLAAEEQLDKALKKQAER